MGRPTHVELQLPEMRSLQRFSRNHLHLSNLRLSWRKPRLDLRLSGVRQSWWQARGQLCLWAMQSVWLSRELGLEALAVLFHELQPERHLPGRTWQHAVRRDLRRNLLDRFALRHGRSAD
jgi:hypothetical protein